MNILIISYNDNDTQIFEKYTLNQINSLIKNKKINITLLLINFTDDNKDFLNKLDTRIESFFVNFKKKKNYISTFEYFFVQEYKTQFLNNLQKILTEKTFDLIQIDSIIFSLFFKNIQNLSLNSAIVYRQHFDELEQLQNLSQNFKLSVFKKLTINKLVKKIFSIQKSFINKFDAIITSHAKLIKKYNFPTKYFILPHKIPNKPNSYDKLKFTYNIFFIGPLYLIETQHSILWFLNEVWPKLLREYPNIKLHLAGESEKWFVNIITNKKNVIYYHQIENFENFLEDKTIFILPYDKTIGILPEYFEIMYKGKIIVAHRDAVHGWELTAMINFLPITNADQFIESILHIYHKNEIQQYFYKQMLNFVQEKITNDYLGEVLANFYSKLIKTNNHYEQNS